MINNIVCVELIYPSVGQSRVGSWSENLTELFITQNCTLVFVLEQKSCLYKHDRFDLSDARLHFSNVSARQKGLGLFGVTCK